MHEHSSNPVHGRGKVKSRTKPHAFTLIEMAIVLVIIGLIAGLVFPLVTDFIKREKRVESNDYVEQVKEEIIGYALINKHLPSSLDDLGGPRVDPYGNELIYHVSSTNDICSGVLPDLLTVDETVPGGTDTYSDIAFTLTSIGRNMVQQMTKVGSTVTIQDPRTFSPPGPEGQSEYDDITEFVSYNFLRNKICTNNTGAFSPPGSDISFAQNMDAFKQNENSSTTTASGQSFMSVDASSGTVTFDTDGSSSDQAACLWYTGNLTGNCTDGVCNFGDGIRAYYKYTVDPDSNGGFTFSIVGHNSTNSINDGPTSTLCGGTCGYLGYAENNGPGIGIDLPKIGIVSDLYGSAGGQYNDTSVTGPGGSVSGADMNFIALHFWRNDNNFNDDVNNAQLAESGDDYNNYQSLPGVYQPGTDAWMEDGIPKTMRIEIHRNNTGDADDSNDTYEIYAWYDCQNCTDLSIDYNTSNPGSTFTATLNNSDRTSTSFPDTPSAQFSQMRFGWTNGICGTQKVTITDFGLSFR